MVFTRKPLCFNHGFSLLEVLVALLVLSIGLLGLALLQTTSLRMNTESYSRTQATILAYDIIDRMRVNSAARASYDVTSTAAANSVISSFQSCKSTTCKCDSSECDPTVLAQYDLGKWYEAQDKWLRGVSNANRSTVDVTVTPTSTTATVIIRWVEQDFPQTQEWVVEL